MTHIPTSSKKPLPLSKTLQALFRNSRIALFEYELDALTVTISLLRWPILPHLNGLTNGTPLQRLTLKSQKTQLKSLALSLILLCSS